MQNPIFQKFTPWSLFQLFLKVKTPDGPKINKKGQKQKKGQE
jgi:hypothetical protein